MVEGIGGTPNPAYSMPIDPSQRTSVSVEKALEEGRAILDDLRNANNDLSEYRRRKDLPALVERASQSLNELKFKLPLDPEKLQEYNELLIGIRSNIKPLKEYLASNQTDSSDVREPKLPKKFRGIKG